MPTRLERLEAQAARAKAKLARTKTALAKVQSQRREATQKARHQRRSALGALVEASGLDILDDATLAGLFAALVPLTTVPNPVAVLEGLLRDVGGLRVSVDGCAQAAPGVPPPVSV
jgi:hypothetical protein